MSETYVELTFVTVGPEAHAAAVAQIREMSSVVVVQDHTRERAWHKRSRLLVPEWDCRIILRVHEPDSQELLGARTGDVTHPYRTLEYGGDLTIRVPAPLVDLSDALHAEYASVRAGRLSFETRTYEPAVLDKLAADLEALDRGQSRCTFQREHGRLFGRIDARVEFVDDLAHFLRRSGLVDFDRLRIDYR